MTDARTETASVVERTRPVPVQAPVVFVRFIGDTAAFVLAEEAVLLASPAGETRRIAVHAGAILSAASDPRRLVTGGDDGTVMATDANGQSSLIATDPRRRWIDHVAVNASGAVAWSAGKDAHVRTQKGEDRVVEAPSTVGGLAFAPKGLRLAIAHYNGVSLWFPNADAAPERLEWKGSHLDVTFSPDGRFLVTAMQEPMLHGWRVADARHMRMSGYATKVRSIDWTAGGKWLATSGSAQLILWPFQGEDGPMGKEPRLLAPSASRVVAVACHPARDVVAVGYEDGLVLLVRIEDGAEIVAKHPGKAPAAALAWDAKGTQLAFGTEEGEAGVVGL